MSPALNLVNGQALVVPRGAEAERLITQCDCASSCWGTCRVQLVDGRRVLDFFFSSRRRHTRFDCDWSSDVCSSDLIVGEGVSFASGIGAVILVIIVAILLFASMAQVDAGHVAVLTLFGRVQGGGDRKSVV